MSNPAKAANAWIFLNEDEPPNTTYNSPDSAYQSLIRHGVYKSVDMLGICFFTITGMPDNPTLQIGAQTHPGGDSNAQYLQWVVRDARAANPGIKLLATLDWGTDWLGPLFDGPQGGWQTRIGTFAANLAAYLVANDLDGFDVDWEPPICNGLDPAQFAILFQAIRAAFKAQTARYLHLTLCPSTTANIDASTINSCFDFVTLQIYYSTALRQEFIDAKVDAVLLAYGAKFESGYQDSRNAYDEAQEDGYGVMMQWRLNSGDYQFEQAQQILLSQLVWPSAASTFDDTPVTDAAGNPAMVQLVVRSGEVLDSLQATSIGTPGAPNQGDFIMGRHGGNSGSPTTVMLALNDPLTQISGFTGDWFGRRVVLQIRLKTRSGHAFGPFGTGANATSKTPFSFTAPDGTSIVAFKGTTVEVPRDGAPPTTVIASLGWTTG